MRKLTVTGAVTAAVLALALGACNWQVPESVNIKGSPSVSVPSGEVVFDLDELDDVLDDMIADFGDGFDEDFNVGEPRRAEDPGGPDKVLPGAGSTEQENYDGRPFRIYAELPIDVERFDSGDIPGGFEDLDVGIDGETDQIDLSDVFGPLSEELKLSQVPGRLTIQFSENATAEDDVQVRLRVTWDGDEHYLIPEGDGNGAPDPATFTKDDDFRDFDLAEAFNARPEDLVLHYELATTSATADRIESITLRVEVPFAFTAAQDVLIDLWDDEDEDDDNPLLMEDDVFGRDLDDPDEDLNDFIDSLRGSAAQAYFEVQNDSGITGRIGMVDSKAADAAEDYDAYRRDTENWLLDFALESGEHAINALITASNFNTMIDAEPGGGEFIPEFVILYERGDDPDNPKTLQLNRGATFEVKSGYLRADAAIDYKFDLD